LIEKGFAGFESMGYFFSINGTTEIANGPLKLVKKSGNMPRSMIKGLKKVLESGRFDEYQYAKYKGSGEVTFKDVIFLTHPKPCPLLRRIVAGELKTPDTWETKMSKTGQEGGNKLDVWRDLLEQRKLGHMALLRNLHNILISKPDEHLVKHVCMELVRGASKGKQLPFRYWSAYKRLNCAESDYGPLQFRDNSDYDMFHLNQVNRALEQALVQSAKSIPNFTKRTMVACDVSASMFSNVSEKSSIKNYEIGLILGACLQANNPENVITGVFGDVFKLFPFANGEHCLGNMKALYDIEGKVGYSTNGYRVIQYLNMEKVKVDQVMVFTDCQVYGDGNMEHEWHKYSKQNLDAKLFVFDLSGYGTAPIRIDGNRVFQIAGWSDRIFEAMERLEKGHCATEMIMQYSK